DGARRGRHGGLLPMAVVYEDREMPLVEHLVELRSRLIVSLLGVGAGTLVVWFWTGELLTWLARPVGGLVFLHPTEAFFARFKLAAYGGFLLALPLVLYEAWAFTARALGVKVRRVIAFMIPASYLLFVAGVSLALTLAVPTATRVLATFGTDNVKPMLSVGEYVGFVEMVSLSFGCVCQLPLVLFFLERVHIVTRRGLASQRRGIYFACLIGGTVLAPMPDVLGQMMVAVPLVLLFELSLAAMWWFEREARKS
ncbi:MAG: twin-arginine translocase subunit TatC, partial [Elusimicrobia bacterium]|nr:twin-arginine translocase subunit TatC [Elusimicrobiota bacterium]